MQAREFKSQTLISPSREEEIRYYSSKIIREVIGLICASNWARNSFYEDSGENIVIVPLSKEPTAKYYDSSLLNTSIVEIYDSVIKVFLFSKEDPSRSHILTVLSKEPVAISFCPGEFFRITIEVMPPVWSFDGKLLLFY